MITKEKIKETLIKIKQQNWKGYKLYFIGGAIENRETKDIDIFITGDGDEKQLVKSINNVQEKGVIDFFVVDSINEEKRGIPFEKGERFAKTYPTLPYHLKDEDCLYWRSFKSSNCSPCAKRESNKNIEKPLLIYNGVI